MGCCGIDRRDCWGLHYLYGPVIGNEQAAELPAVYTEDFYPDTPIMTAEHRSHRLLGVSENEGVVKLPQPPIRSWFKLESDKISFLHIHEHDHEPFSQQLQDGLYHS